MVILKQNVKKVWKRRSNAFPPHYTDYSISSISKHKHILSSGFHNQQVDHYTSR